VSSSPIETVIDVTMPQMGVSVAEGTVVEWKKRPGDWVEADETICEVSTDKIDTEVPSPASGRVTEVLVEVDTTVDVGTVLARIATDASPGEAHADEHIEPAHSPAPPPKPQGNGHRAGRRYSPVVQRIAAEHDVDLEQVEGTGRGGRVRKQDVLAFVERGSAEPPSQDAPLHIESPYRPDPTAPAPAGGETLSRMRRSIGEHMKRSLDTAATCTTWIEADMSRVERVRRDAGLTALPYVARATIDALREYPAVNAWLQGEEHTVHQDVNLGIAVSLGEDGLIVPVIRAAQDLSAEGLSKRIKDLARAARSRTLRPDDVQDGTFTITNPGQFGSIMATPVINQPQVAILDLEAVVKRPVVVTDEDGNDSIAIRPMTVLGLSWDHRALDGALAAQFLAAIKRRIETLPS
jgi:pyruvate/2-oxoglutarate dehydrogenase complex dihydrolipoamide acyltransferase (E2) component